MRVQIFLVFAAISSCILASAEYNDNLGQFLRDKREQDAKNELWELTFGSKSGEQLLGDMQYKETSKIELGKNNQVEDLAISSEGDFLVVGLQNTTTLVYNNENIIAAFEGDENNTAVTINDKLIAEARQKGQVRIFDRQTFENLYNTSDFFYSWFGVNALTFSEDGKYMAVGASSYIDIYSLEPSLKLMTTKTQFNRRQITDFSFAKNSTLLVSVSENAIQTQNYNEEDNRWNVDKQLVIDSFETKAVFSNDYLAVSIDNNVVVYDINDFNSNQTIEIESNSTGMAFSKDGSKLIIGTEKHGVKIYNSGSWELQYQVKDDSSYINVAKQINDNLIVGYTNGEDSYLSIFTLKSGGGGDDNSAFIFVFNFILFVISCFALF